MKTKLFVAFFSPALAGMLSLVPLVQAQTFEVGARLWQMEPSGTASVGIEGIEGTEIDIERDLGYGEKEDVIGFDAILGDTFGLGVSYLTLDLSARARVEREIRFSDRIYRASADVESSLEAQLVRGVLRFQTGKKPFKGGLLGGAQWVDLTAELYARGIGRASEDAQAVLPVLGAFLSFEPVPFFQVGGSIAGGSWDFDSVGVTFWDAEGYARLQFLPFFAGLGYRHVVIEGDDSEIPLEVDLKFRGVQLSAGLYF